MPKLSTSTNVNSIQICEQNAAPTTPVFGYVKLYAHTLNGVLHCVMSDGVIVVILDALSVVCCDNGVVCYENEIVYV